MRVSITFFLLLTAASALAQLKEPQTRNIIIVTLDGYRWQEVFRGADDKLLSKELHPKNDDNKFAVGNLHQRRSRLMPFFWSTIVTQGQLYGNRDLKNKVNCSNNHLLSYPGYSEMLVGFNHPDVTSNKNIENPSPTVLEIINQHPRYRGEVAAFTTWDAFPHILRENKSRIFINAGSDIATGAITSNEKILNERQAREQNPHGARYDKFTFEYAMEYLKRKRPRVMFIGFDETDEHGHDGRYADYLNAAHETDQMIGQLWSWIQSQPDYRNQTTLFITTDHGRGKGRSTWKNHRLFARGSRQIWFAVLGPDTPGFGEMRMKQKYFQKQVAKTIAAFLGIDYSPKQIEGEVVQTMIANQQVESSPVLGRKSQSPTHK